MKNSEASKKKKKSLKYYHHLFRQYLKKSSLHWYRLLDTVHWYRLFDSVDWYRLLLCDRLIQLNYYGPVSMFASVCPVLYRRNNNELSKGWITRFQSISHNNWSVEPNREHFHLHLYIWSQNQSIRHQTEQDQLDSTKLNWTEIIIVVSQLLYSTSTTIIITIT